MHAFRVQVDGRKPWGCVLEGMNRTKGDIMRYIYELRNRDLRRSVSLRTYESEIKEALREFQSMELIGMLGEFSLEADGNILISHDSFSFRFPGCLPRSSLQKMGKILAKYLDGAKGFVRKHNTAFVFVSLELDRDEDEQVLLEFVDCSTLNFEQIHDTYVEIKRMDQDWVSFYRRLEINTASISKEKAKLIFGEVPNQDVQMIYEVEFRHRVKDMVGGDRREFAFENLASRSCVIEHLYSSGLYQPDLLNMVDIIWFSRVPYSQEKKLHQLFEQMSAVGSTLDEFGIDRDQHRRIGGVTFRNGRDTEGREVLEGIWKDCSCGRYLFTVHNVGQGQATSLREKDEYPFFYFDYGIANAGNKRTLPAGINLPVGPSTIIMLSHVHEDHWCGYRCNPDAFRCRWIIPQTPKKALTKVLAGIVMCGGKFILLNPTGKRVKLLFGCAQNRLCADGGNDGVSSQDLHKTGIALSIFRRLGGPRILVAGDQKYNHHPKHLTAPTDILVASHHGGKFGSGSVPLPKTKRSIVVYSYGKNNKYGHPSEIKNYIANGWVEEHHTPNGDFEIVI